MLHIFCPHCGELRSEEEFHAKGQAHIPRPLDPTACTDAENPCSSAITRAASTTSCGCIRLVAASTSTPPVTR